MLCYENIIYEDIKETCIFHELEMLLDVNKSNIERFSSSYKIDEDIVKKQVRLIAPQFEKKNYSHSSRSFFKRNILPILEKSLNGYEVNFNKYCKNAGADLLDEKLKVVKLKDNKAIIEKNNSRFELEIKEVDLKQATFIEEKLHYLKCARTDALMRIGLYIKGYAWPICYMSFASVDREDKLMALSKSTSIHIEKNRVIELARVYGCGKLPQNTVSYMLGYIARKLREEKYDFMITAVNITLGFNGGSMIASQFVPYAIRPVKYQYDADGKFCTQRVNRSVCQTPNDMPPNILYVREIKSTNGKKMCYCKMVDIRHNYSYNENAIEHEIYMIRKQLEEVWSDKTRYHGTLNDSHKYISKGQCGVSSLLLARILVSKGYNALFCEGDAIFQNDQESIYNHCWVKILDYNRRKQNVLIDITADQNGYSKRIIFMSETDLEHAKIKYKTKSEKTPEEIDVEHLITRLEYLEKAREEFLHNEVGGMGSE